MNHDEKTGQDTGEYLKKLKFLGKGLANKVRSIDLYDKNNPDISQEYRTVWEAIDHMDVNQVKWKDYKPELQKRGVSEDVIQAIDMIRNSNEKALHYMMAEIKTVIDAWAKVHGTNDGPVLFTEKVNGKNKKYTLRHAYEAMGQHRGYYAPRIRETGTHFVTGTKDGFDYRYHKPGRTSANAWAKKLRRNGYKDVEFGEIKKMPETVFHDITIGDVSQVLNKAIERSELGDKEVAKARVEIIEAAAEILQSRAFRSHRIKRKGGKGDVVKGYIEDPLTRHLIYTNRIAGGVAKGKFAKEAMEALNSLDATENQELHDYMKSYIQEQLRNQDKIDRGIGLAKSIISMKYLTNPKAPVVNTTATITTAPPAIRTYALDGKVNVHKIFAEIGRSGKDYAKLMAGKSTITDKGEKAFMDSIKESGYDNPQYMRDALGDIQSFYGKSWSNVMEMAMTPFAKSEQWNRGTTMLAAYRLCRKEGFSHEDSMKRAKKASDKAHGLYGKATLPSWAQGRGAFKRVMQMGYTYQKFGHNYVQMLVDLGYNKKDIQSLITAVAMPTIIGGAKSSILFTTTALALNAALRAIGDDREVEKVVYDYIRKEYGENTELVARYGVFGFLGIDLSGSLSVGMQVPSHLIDLTGAFGGAYNDAKDAVKYAKTNQYSRALEKALPTVAGNILRAIREYNHGVHKSGGEPLYTDEGEIYKPALAESIRKGMSFRSSKQATLQERRYEVVKEKERYSNARENILNEFEAWFANQGDEKWFDAIMDKVFEYNDRVVKEGRSHYIPMITKDSLMRKANRMIKPTKKQYMELQ